MATIILCIGSAEDPHIQEVEKNVKLLDNDARIVLFNPLCGGHFIEITVDSSCELSSSCLENRYAFIWLEQATIISGEGEI